MKRETRQHKSLISGCGGGTGFSEGCVSSAGVLSGTGVLIFPNERCGHMREWVLASRGFVIHATCGSGFLQVLS